MSFFLSDILSSLSTIILSSQSFFPHFHLRGFYLRSVILLFLLRTLSDHSFLIFPIYSFFQIIPTAFLLRIISSQSFRPPFSYICFLPYHSILIFPTYSFFQIISSSFFLRILTSRSFYPNFSYVFFCDHSFLIIPRYSFFLTIPSLFSYVLFLLIHLFHLFPTHFFFPFISNSFFSIYLPTFLLHFCNIFFYPNHSFFTFSR